MNKSEIEKALCGAHLIVRNYYDDCKTTCHYILLNPEYKITKHNGYKHYGYIKCNSVFDMINNEFLTEERTWNLETLNNSIKNKNKFVLPHKDSMYEICLIY